MTPPVVLTIAGSDSGGGAGVQGDLKTFAALGAYGATVITIVTAQNTVGVQRCETLTSDLVAAQIHSVIDDLPVAAVKVGALGDAGVARVVSGFAMAARLPNLVVDPVTISSTGESLFAQSQDAADIYLKGLFPFAKVITPNAAEASAFLKWRVDTAEGMAEAASQLHKFGPDTVVVTGGDFTGDQATDVYFDGKSDVQTLSTERVKSNNTHGTGCTFSSAIATYIALGLPVRTAIEQAKLYVTASIERARAWELGTGKGPVAHFAEIETGGNQKNRAV